MEAEVGIAKAEVKSGARRRWLPRFSLRTLLIAVTAISLALGAATFWYRAQEDEYRRQLKICEELKEFGDVHWEQKAPSWLQWMGNSKAFERVTRIDCHGSAVAGQVLDIVEQLPTIDTIEFYDDQRQFTDAVVQRLAALKGLKQLLIKHCVELWSNHPPYEILEARLRAATEFSKGLQRHLPHVHVQLVEVELL